MKPLTKYLMLAGFGFLIFGILARIFTSIPPKTGPDATQTPRSDAIEIELWTNDTKAEWVHAVTAPFNETGIETSSGNPVYVNV
jgi:hypothetical protein